MSDEEEDSIPSPKLELPVRKTRGLRMEELVGDAAEADAEFWGQAAWQEISDDESIGSEEYDSEEKKDIEDEDFDEVDEEAEQRERVQDAVEQEEQAVKQSRNESNKRKKGVYVDPALKKSSTKKKLKTQKSKSNVIPASSRTVRASTTSKTFNTAENIQKHAQRSISKKIKPPEMQFTQQQLLEEAAKTEIENRRSLALMLMLQEEGKRTRANHEKMSDKRVIYFSSSRRNGPNTSQNSNSGGSQSQNVITTLSFTQVSEIPSVIHAVAIPPPEKPICSVTGLPAKYRDPKTGIPYRTIEAFKVHRGGKQKT